MVAAKPGSMGRRPEAGSCEVVRHAGVGRQPFPIISAHWLYRVWHTRRRCGAEGERRHFAST